MIDKTVKKIKKYVKDNGFKKVIIGLSGGIDSSVVAALCVKALGAKNVHGLILPCCSSANSLADAIIIGKQLKIDYNSIGLLNIFNKFENFQKEITKANIKARLRMVMLYAYANEMDALVVGTTNKTEAEIGYYTKYGDGGVDFEPIGNYYKYQIYEMAEKLKIPQQIIDKKPSADLWDNQTDEKELGITYDRLDKILTKQDNPTLKEKALVDKLVKNSEHKRCMPPIL